MDKEERDNFKKIHSVELKRLRLLSEIKTEEKKFNSVKQELTNPHVSRVTVLAKLEEKLRAIASEKESELVILKAKKEKLSKTPNKLKPAVTRDVFQTQKSVDKLEEEIQKLRVQYLAEREAMEQEKSKSAENEELIDMQSKETREEVSSIKKRIEDIETEIQAIRSQLTEVLLREFSRAFEKNPMDPLVPVTEDRKCSACNLTINPQHFLKLHDTGVFTKCAGCYRLLE